MGNLELSHGEEIPEGAAPTQSAEFYTFMQQMLSGTSLAGADLKDSLGVEFATDQTCIYYEHPNSK